MARHTLDIHPIPEGQELYINEPWLVDDSLFQYGHREKEPDHAADNVRVYIPLDLNREAILRRLRQICARYGDVDWKNESDFSCDVARLICQIEIYDQVWRSRHPITKAGRISRHSAEGAELAGEVIRILQAVGDNGSGESFPYETIEELKKEYKED